MTMDLTRACYGDPADVHQQQEAQTCNGCCYEIRKKTDKDWIMVCAFLGRQSPQRCSRYLSRDGE